MSAGRKVFWAMFGAGACAALWAVWTKADPLRKHPWLAERYLAGKIEAMKHSDPRVGAAAWGDVANAFGTSWASFQIVMRLAEQNDAAPVWFLVEKEKFPVPGEAAREGFWATSKAVFHKTDRVYCRTVGDAVRAIIYNERKWTQDWDGDWSAWWTAVKPAYRL